MASSAQAQPAHKRAAPAVTLKAVPASAPAAALVPVPKAVQIAPEKLRLLAVSEGDKRAVIAFPDGVMVSATAGEAIARTGAVLTEVGPSRVTLEIVQSGQDGKEIIWMHKAQGAQPGRIERFSSIPAPVATATAPVTRTVVVPPAGKASATPAPRQQ